MKRIFVYRTGDSLGARVLARYLQRNYPDARVSRVRRLPDDLSLTDLVVAWGSKVPAEMPCYVLNEEAPMGDKHEQLLCMARNGVPVPCVSSEKREGWFARRNNHHSANDLLANLAVGDYYVEPTPASKELRCHVFDKAVFRVALKVPRHPGAHPIFHTDSAGWRLEYSLDVLNRELPSRRDYYNVACRAVRALGYDFGAVDLGIRSTGKPVIYEVNSAPGLEGTTIDSYGQQIIKWIKAER